MPATPQSHDDREAELDRVLTRLDEGVKRIRSCKNPSSALTPAEGIDMRQVRRTRLTFAALAEDSLLEDSNDALPLPQLNRKHPPSSRPAVG